MNCIAINEIQRRKNMNAVCNGPFTANRIDEIIRVMSVK